MPFSAFLYPRLEAAAYLAEILIAEYLFLGGLVKRPHFILRAAGSGLLVLLVGTVSGIPAQAGFPRFLWFLCAMAACIAAAVCCFEDDVFTVSSACVAGFATQHIANKCTILLGLIPVVSKILAHSEEMHAVLEILVFGYIYLLIYYVFGRRNRGKADNIQLRILAIVIILTCIGVNRLVVDSATGNVYFEIAACIYAILCCVFALMIQFTIARWQEADTERLLIRQHLADAEKQYEQWTVNAGMIKVWIHDLRHLMDRIERHAKSGQGDGARVPDLTAIREAVDRLSPTVRTGNDTLDTLLRNTDDLCRQNGITLQCVAYADCLKNLDGTRLYFLFQNAIDNAVESVSAIEDPEKRLIDISIRSFGDSASIRIWNYYAGRVSFSDGLPVSRRQSQGHGYGMKSMQRIVDAFGGVMDARTEGEIFRLDIMLPTPRSGGDGVPAAGSGGF